MESANPTIHPELQRSDVVEAEDELVDGADIYGLGGEYSVVAPRISALVVAYAAFLAVFGWFELFFTIWDGPWMAAFAGGFVIALLGTLAAWRARLRQPGFAALVALLLDGGLVVALVVPVLGFLVVLYWP